MDESLQVGPGFHSSLPPKKKNEPDAQKVCFDLRCPEGDSKMRIPKQDF